LQPLAWKLFRSGRWNLDQLTYRNRARFACESGKKGRFGSDEDQISSPADKDFSGQPFAEAQPPSNPSDCSSPLVSAGEWFVSLLGFLVPGRPSPRVRKSTQPTSPEALLIAAKAIGPE